MLIAATSMLPALITPQAARTAPAIRQVAVYELALLMDTSGSWVERSGSVRRIATPRSRYNER